MIDAATDIRPGKWLVLQPDRYGITHILPDFGRGHDTTEDGLACWCMPRWEALEDGRVLVIHDCDN
jgi:hypothetical protein